MKKYAYYFLQSRSAPADGGSHWGTLAQTRTRAEIEAGLAREIARDGTREMRLVGASYDEGTGDWRYAQLFYIDRGSVTLPASLPGTGGAAGHEYGASPYDAPENIRPLMQGAARGPDMPGARDTHASSMNPGMNPGMNPDTNRGMNAGAGSANPKVPPFFHQPPEPERRPAWRIALLLILVPLLAASFVASILLYLQHPSILALADRVGLGAEARMFPHAMTGEILPSGEEATVMPHTSGTVLTYPGIALPLAGRWSPDDCARNYVVFTERGYMVTRDGKTSPGMVVITETLEDDFQYYLRRSPTLLEHLHKISGDEIQMTGSTGTVGFMPSDNLIQILKRCPLPQAPSSLTPSAVTPAPAIISPEAPPLPQEG